jgi:single-strand DNA-binding protein
MKNMSIIGHVGAPVSVVFTETAKKIGSFSVAVSERITNKQTGEKEQKTDWFRVVIFGSLIDIAEKFLDTGSKVYVHGQFRVNKWTDKNGILQTTVEVIANQLEFLSRKENAEHETTKPNKPYGDSKTSSDAGKSQATPPKFDDEDIPF